MHNVPYGELHIGSSASLSRTLTEEDVILFARVSGDIDPVHLDEDYAQRTRFNGRIVHNMFSAGLISAALATVMPGPGTLYLGQTLNFRHPIRPGDELTVTLTVAGKQDEERQVVIDCKVVNQDSQLVVDGEARVTVPAERIEVAPAKLPPISVGN